MLCACCHRRPAICNRRCNTAPISLTRPRKCSRSGSHTTYVANAGWGLHLALTHMPRLNALQLKLKAKKQAQQKAAAQAEDGSASALAGVTARAPASSGRVVGMDWKVRLARVCTAAMASASRLCGGGRQVGVRVASDRCEELNTAFVTVVLRIANADGEVTANAVEMSVPEFNVRDAWWLWLAQVCWLASHLVCVYACGLFSRLRPHCARSGESLTACSNKPLCVAGNPNTFACGSIWW